MHLFIDSCLVFEKLSGGREKGGLTALLTEIPFLLNNAEKRMVMFPNIS